MNFIFKVIFSYKKSCNNYKHIPTNDNEKIYWQLYRQITRQLYKKYYVFLSEEVLKKTLPWRFRSFFIHLEIFKHLTKFKAPALKFQRNWKKITMGMYFFILFFLHMIFTFFFYINIVRFIWKADKLPRKYIRIPYLSFIILIFA